MTQLPDSGSEVPVPVGPKVRHRAVLKNLPVGYRWSELKVRDRVRVRVRSQLARAQGRDAPIEP